MEKGYDRFLGFADTYDEGRPKLPEKAIEILKNYKNDIKLIVDIGCGTGNSTQVCINYANRVIGIEPSEDRLFKAREKENDKLSFKKGLGDNTGLDDNIADIVICSQAFHWMNSQTTIT
ncbi:MAG: class I SAM-dependent methyltransferase [Clostridia bacterium]|nr:class I SAM-dependent methyltransferase [Clostridia bacterium]